MSEETNEFNLSSKEECDSKHLYNTEYEGYTELHFAAHTGDLYRFHNALKEGIDIDAQTKLGKTALYIAAERGQVEIVKELLELGADVNLKAEDETLLHAASSSPNPNLLEKIVKLLPHLINEQTKEGYTALHNASIVGNPSCISILLNNGASLDIVNNEGDDALILATRARQTAAVAFLLEQKMDPNKKNKDGNSPLHIATANGDINTVNVLLEEERTDLNISNEKGETPEDIARRMTKNRNREKYASILCDILEAKKEYAERQRLEQQKQELAKASLEIDPALKQQGWGCNVC